MYCVKHRAKKEMKNAKNVIMKNGRPVTQGVCPTCGEACFLKESDTVDCG